MKKKYFLFLFLSFFINWHPIHTFLFPFDGKGRIISILGTILFLIGLIKVNKSFFKNGNYYDLPILLLVIWSSINIGLLNPVIDPKFDIHVFFVNVILPFVIYYGFRLNFQQVSIKEQWLWFSISLLVYLTLALVFDSPDPSLQGRFGRFLNGNEIAWVGLLAVFSTSFLNRKYLFYGTLILVFFLIIITASKKAMLSFFFFLGFKYLISGKSAFSLRLVRIIIFTAILGLSLPYLIEDTVIAERIQSSVEANKHSRDDSELFDGRAQFYIKGFDLFLDSPFSGIGLTNFYYLGGMRYVLHSEYLTQLVEFGMIGFIIFFIFHFRLIKSLLYLMRSKFAKYDYAILFISLLTCYGMFFGRWVYDSIPYHIFLALTVNTILDNNKRLNFDKESK